MLSTHYFSDPCAGYRCQGFDRVLSDLLLLLDAVGDGQTYVRGKLHRYFGSGRLLLAMVAYGLRGVRLVTSDSQQDLKGAIEVVLQGVDWQCCRTHFVRDVPDK